MFRIIVAVIVWNLCWITSSAIELSDQRVGRQLQFSIFTPYMSSAPSGGISIIGIITGDDDEEEEEVQSPSPPPPVIASPVVIVNEPARAVTPFQVPISSFSSRFTPIPVPSPTPTPTRTSGVRFTPILADDVQSPSAPTLESVAEPEEEEEEEPFSPPPPLMSSPPPPMISPPPLTPPLSPPPPVLPSPVPVPLEEFPLPFVSFSPQRVTTSVPIMTRNRSPTPIVPSPASLREPVASPEPANQINNDDINTGNTLSTLTTPQSELTPLAVFELYQQITGNSKVDQGDTSEDEDDFPLLPIEWLNGLEELGLVEYVGDLPENPVTLSDLLEGTPVNDPEMLSEIQNFIDLLEAMGLDTEICKIENVVTVLAPVNTALIDDWKTVDNPQQLLEILSYHVVLLPPSQLFSGERVPTLKSQSQLLVAFERPAGRFTFVQEQNSQHITNHGAFVHYLDGVATPLSCDAVFVAVDDNLDPPL